MKWNVILAVTLAVFLTKIVLADDVVTVTVTGYGRHPADAEKDAIRAAVEKVVGQFVDAETLVKNEDVIRDQVLTYSDGIVKRIVSKDDPVKDGDIYKVKLVAEVEPGKVTERLKDAKISTANVQGVDLWAQGVSEIKNVKDGRRLLQKFFSDYPVKNLLIAELIDDKGNRGKEATPSQEANYEDPNTIAIAINVAIRFDLDQYYEKYVPKLTKLLDAVCDKVSASMPRNTPQNNQARCGITGVPNRALAFEPWKDANTEDNYYVGVNVGRDRLGINQRFSVYNVNAAAYDKIFQSQRIGLGDVKISFMAENGKEISSDNISIGSGFNEYPQILQASADYKGRFKVPLNGCHEVSLSSRNCFWRNSEHYMRYGSYVSPEFYAGGGLCDEVIIRYETEMATEDVKAIKEIRVQVK